MIRPGVTTAEVVGSRSRRREEFGFPDEEAAFALQYGHGVGLSIWEKPIFCRLVSFDYPETIEEGMVFALETFWPSTDGWSAARIEEQLIVTAGRLRGDHPLPGRGAARHGAAASTPSAATLPGDARGDVQPEQPGSTMPSSSRPRSRGAADMPST